MSPTDYKSIVHNGLWTQNTGVVQLLGLCPLLAISTSVVNAVGLGLATALVMTFCTASAAFGPRKTISPM